MSMTVRRRKDDSLPRVFMHKIADIRGGVSVMASELGGNILLEGAVLSAPEDGICHVVKLATVTADVSASDTEIKVKKGHNLSVGDVVMAKVGGTAVAITAIDTTANGYDTITVGSAVGEITAGGNLIEAAEAGDAGALKYTPFALNGTSKPFSPDSNINTDAWLIGVTTNNPLPEGIAEVLKGIINY